MSEKSIIVDGTFVLTEASFLSSSRATAEFRWLQTEDEKILQQQWVVETQNGTSYEWRDIPTVQENE